MANRIPSYGEFSIPSNILTLHEWISDSLIDNGRNCKLVYPQKEDQCINCVQDIDTGRSAAIYKSGGPVPFANYTLCPYCNGEGRLYTPEEEVIKCRVYYNAKQFMSNVALDQNHNILIDNDTIQIVTYLSNLSKINRAIFLIVDSDISSAKQYKCQPLSAALPHGFRHNRYLIQLWKKIG